MEQYFENLSAETVFRDSLGALKNGSTAGRFQQSLRAWVASARVQGQGEEYDRLIGNWDDELNKVFDLVRDVAMESEPSSRRTTNTTK